MLSVKRLLSRKVRKCTFGHVHPVKIQISLRVDSHSLNRIFTGRFWIAMDAKLLLFFLGFFMRITKTLIKLADLSLRGARISKGSFSEVTVHIILKD